ncbi:penicillin-binding transpeptidase domain-containing protein [Massilia suwonensis]|uniref:beta-lactamase n=1 Tax=Massilia suwonensis TaxID=648895 RepID=A0ABW0MTY0_9BURK
MFATVFAGLAGLAGSGRAWRRARNLRAGRVRSRPRIAAVAWQPGPRLWLALPALGLVLGGALLIAQHARSLAALAPGASSGGPVRSLGAFQPALPGISFSVPATAGVTLSAQPGGALLVVSHMRGERPVVIDLCSQALAGSGGRLAPLRIGYPFAEAARWAARNAGGAAALTLRNVVLAGAGMPKVDITGSLGGALRLGWQGDARWIGDVGAGAIARGSKGMAMLGREGWLVWGEDRALRITRRANAACVQGGDLVLTSYVPGGAGGALVAAFPEHGRARSLRLAPGDYRVPGEAPAALEDGALFDELLARGLVRLSKGGMIETVPRDLAAWRAADPAQRTADLRSWDGVVLDAGGRRLLERLHARADGAYVREQIRVFNGERRLLAWRLRPGAQAAWLAQAGAIAAATSEAMPLGAARLFDSLPQGWAPWQRIADWPANGANARLSLTLAAPARGGERIELMLAGRVLSVEGATVAGSRPVCSGRACSAPDEVRELVLAPQPGVRRIVIEAAPLDLAAMGGNGDAAYRHLQVRDGQLAWQAIAQPARAATAAPVPVQLADRSGAPLWEAGSATAAARAAGLATLLGLDARHGSSIAGMLARLPAPSGRPHAATLTLDLDLQRSSQAVLDCVGLRRGQWDGARCSGGVNPPAKRQAGLVVLDTGSGDILAAAGSGLAANAPWPELRDFDRVDPARSPLRQSAFQHDGGAERSPGSTFKIVSALGLELAAQRDPQLDALLGGMPLAGINAYAAARGYAFRTDGATYPLGGSGARITNFRDGTLDRRAQDGKLGLSQALTYSLNTWFAWGAELSDASLLGKPQGGVPSLRALDAAALTGVRPILDMAERLGFERPMPLDGGLLPADYDWRNWDALQASVAGFDPIGTRHELRQMAIGLRMQATPLHMALAAGAVGEGRAINPRLLLALDGRQAEVTPGAPLGVRLDRIRAGLHGVVTHGTAASAFRAPEFERLRPGLFGKTGTAPVGDEGQATVWFTGWLEPGSLPGQTRRLAFAAFVSRSEATGGEHAAPIVAALLRTMAQKPEQKDK